MAGELNIGLKSAVKNPDRTFNVRTQNKDFSTESFTSRDANLFEQQFNVLLNDLDSRHLSELFAQRSREIANAAALAKQELDEPLFGGINANDNEIAFDILRPGHVRADPSNGDIQNDWYFEPSSSGWNDWIGDGSTNNYTVDEDQIVLVLGFMDQDPTTEISGINVESFGRNVDMIPKDLNHARTYDNDNEVLIQALPTLIGTDRDDIHIRLRHDKVMESQPRLLGITFGIGNYMNMEDFS